MNPQLAFWSFTVGTICWHRRHLILVFHATSLAMLFTTCTNSIIHLFYSPKNLHRHWFRLPLGHFHVPGEIANNGYAKVLGGNRGVIRGVLWDCASNELLRKLHKPFPDVRHLASAKNDVKQVAFCFQQLFSQPCNGVFLNIRLRNVRSILQLVS